MAVEEDRNGNLWAWWLPPGWTGDPTGAFVTGSHLDSVPDGGAFDGPLGVVSAFAAVDIVRDARRRPDDSRCGGGILRRGGRPLRRRLRRIAARHRCPECRAGPWAARQRRRHARRGADARRSRSRAPRRRRRAARAHRRLRRTARRAGPRAGPRRPPDRRGVGDLAARALGVHLRRCGQPRGHHPAGRSARSDAGLRVVGARRARRRRPRTRRSPRSARCSCRPTGPTRFRPGSGPGSTPAPPTRRR